MPGSSKSNKRKKTKLALAITKGFSALAGLSIAAVVITTKALRGEIVGVAAEIGAVGRVIGNASGTQFFLDKMGERVRESKFGKSKVGKGLIDAASFSWSVITSSPVKLAIRVAGIALAATTATTPVGWALIGLSAAYIAISAVISSINTGKTKRLEKEVANLRGKTEVVDLKVLAANPNLAKFLSNKLDPDGFDRAKVHEGKGASVAKMLLSNLIEGAGGFLSAVTTGSIVEWAAASCAAVGGVASEAKEAIERKQRQNQALMYIEETKIKIVCAKLAKEMVKQPDILSQDDIEQRFDDIYKAEFPPKTIGAKLANVFKDFAGGFGDFISAGIPGLNRNNSKGRERFEGEISAPITQKEQVNAKTRAERQEVVVQQSVDHQREGFEAKAAVQATITPPQQRAPAVNRAVATPQRQRAKTL